jgi:2'-5' RNA ligase
LKHRLFFAISLPETTQTAITRLYPALESVYPHLVFEPPEKLHITMNFLGRQEQEQIPQINKIGLNTTAQVPSFELTPSFLDCMYKKHAGSYVYLGLSGDLDTLKHIHKSLSLLLSDLNIPQAHRFFPHITIARFKKTDPVSLKSAMDKIDELEFTPLQSFLVEKLTLYESLLSQKGSHYRVVGEYLLK